MSAILSIPPIRALAGIRANSERLSRGPQRGKPSWPGLIQDFTGHARRNDVEGRHEAGHVDCAELAVHRQRRRAT
jgi:hypothetical protein